MKKYKVQVKFFKVTKNSSVERDFYSAICIINNSDTDTVYLNDVVSIAPLAKFAMNDEPYVVFDTDLFLRSDSGAMDVTVLKTSYHEI